jgi:VanZ family protein
MPYTASPHGPQVFSLRGWHLAAAAALLAVSLQMWGLYRVTGPPQSAWFPSADKLDHAVGFALPVLLILLTVTMRGVGWQWPGPRSSALIVAVFAAHAVVSEVIQHLWYRDRTGDPSDVVADWVGLAVGVLAFRMIVQRRSRSVAEGPTRL